MVAPGAAVGSGGDDAGAASCWGCNADTAPCCVGDAGESGGAGACGAVAFFPVTGACIVFPSSVTFFAVNSDAVLSVTDDRCLTIELYQMSFF